MSELLFLKWQKLKCGNVNGTSSIFIARKRFLHFWNSLLKLTSWAICYFRKYLGLYITWGEWVDDNDDDVLKCCYHDNLWGLVSRHLNWLTVPPYDCTGGVKFQLWPTAVLGKQIEYEMIGGKTVMKLLIDLLLFILWSMIPSDPIHTPALARLRCHIHFVYMYFCHTK